jgi:hypothetical protein
MDGVDWSLLSEAVRFYEDRTYRRIELPWFQPVDVVVTTCPDLDRILQVEGFGALIGSAEQSFIGADLAGKLGKGRFVACTPCFRNEPVLDRTHRVGFMKVELYCNVGDLAAEAERMMWLADEFMSLAAGRGLRIEETEQGRDLMLGDVEVGSYGTRAVADVAWAYGTGVAEPRFTTALRMADGC